MEKRKRSSRGIGLAVCVILVAAVLLFGCGKKPETEVTEPVATEATIAATEAVEETEAAEETMPMEETEAATEAATEPVATKPVETEPVETEPTVTEPVKVSLRKMYVTTDANYRTGPGTSYDRVGTLAKGTSVQVVEGSKTNGWYCVVIDGENYYIAANLLSKNAPAKETTKTEPVKGEKGEDPVKEETTKETEPKATEPKETKPSTKETEPKETEPKATEPKETESNKKDETTSSKDEDKNKNDKTDKTDKDTSKEETKETEPKETEPKKDTSTANKMDESDYVKPADVSTGISWDGKSPIVYTYTDGSTGTTPKVGARYEVQPGCYTRVTEVDLGTMSKEEYMEEYMGGADDGYCNYCGKETGDGSGGTCVRWSLVDGDHECPSCGETVPERTCHTCDE